MRLCSCNLKVVWQFGEIATGISCSHSPTLRVFKIAFLLLLFSLCLFLFCLLHYFPSCPPHPSVYKVCTSAWGRKSICGSPWSQWLQPKHRGHYPAGSSKYSLFKENGLHFFFFNVLSHDSSAELKPPKWWVLNYKCFWKAFLIY